LSVGRRHAQLCDMFSKCLPKTTNFSFEKVTCDADDSPFWSSNAGGCHLMYTADEFISSASIPFGGALGAVGAKESNKKKSN
jgi:hypothetical protein